MYELLNTLVTKLNVIKNNQNAHIGIDEETASYKWCAVDKENEVAIDVLTEERYTYLNTMSGLYVLNHYMINPNERYALMGIKQLEVPNNIQKRYLKIKKSSI